MTPFHHLPANLQALIWNLSRGPRTMEEITKDLQISRGTADKRIMKLRLAGWTVEEYEDGARTHSTGPLPHTWAISAEMLARGRR